MDAQIVFVLRIQPIIGKFATLASAYGLSVAASAAFLVLLLAVIDLLHNQVLLRLDVIVRIRGREVLRVIDQLVLVLLILRRPSEYLRLDHHRAPTS